jgi:cytochrome b involved in lipid metabolism
MRGAVSSLAERPKTRDAVISLAELSRHTRRDDAWIAVDGFVYNITPHLNNHAGWKDGSVTTVVAIITYLGTDASLAWHAVGVHASPKVQAELRSYRIGRLDGCNTAAENDRAQPKATSSRWRPAGEAMGLLIAGAALAAAIVL